MFSLKKSLSFLRKKGPDLFLLIMTLPYVALGIYLYILGGVKDTNCFVRIASDILGCILGFVITKFLINSWKSVRRNEKEKMGPSFYVFSAIVLIVTFVLFSINGILHIDCGFIQQLSYAIPISSFTAVAGEILGKFLK